MLGTFTPNLAAEETLIAIFAQSLNGINALTWEETVVHPEDINN